VKVDSIFDPDGPYQLNRQNRIRLVNYAAEMPTPPKTEIESQVRQWIKRNKKENCRLEFKQRIDLSTAGAKAEFIRDVIALANSEGECPRNDSHLVVGFRNGKCYDIQWVW
jgi:hypothetical protein